MNDILVDECDEDLLEKYKWYPTKFRNTKYAQTHNRLRIHRIILERILKRKLVKGEVVDHINRNGLDNRRENLRLSDYSRNAMNCEIDKSNASSKYRGISKHGKKWLARFGKKGTYIGLFKTELEAYKARECYLNKIQRCVSSPGVKVD